MTIDCNVLVFDEKQEELTGNSNEDWVECSVDLGDISAVRMCKDNNREGYAVLHFRHGDYFIVDREYKEVVKIWKEYINR